MKASVVIPTKNPGPVFRSVLDRVVAQACPWPFEILIIDSGSTDGTLDFIESHPTVRLHPIKPHEFGHGRTRNLGVRLTTGDFVAFLTHDALPVDTDWLVRIVAAVEAGPDIAGAFGRHVAYPEATAFTKRDLEAHFAAFDTLPPVVSRATDAARYETDQGWRQRLHFYSDNNSCLRRSVWEEIPYPDVEFAEDQIWADRIIAAGYAKAYAPDAAVYHSHDYGVFEKFQRAFDESNAFRVLFGYRLNARPLRALLSIGWLSKRDIAFAIRNRISPVETTKQILLNFATVTGQMAGSHAARLPESVRLRLSRDKRLQHSLPAAAAAGNKAS